MPFFVVVNEQGPAWVASRPMRDQALWREHADFVNGLMGSGFILLGGPLGPGHPHRALLVVSAESEESARARLLEDPWMKAGTLRLGRLDRWEILVSNDRLDPALAELGSSTSKS